MEPSSPLQGENGGAGALAAFRNRYHAFAGELESLTPHVGHSNR